VFVVPGCLPPLSQLPKKPDWAMLLNSAGVVDVWVDAVGEWVLGSATQLVADTDGKLSIVVSADEMGISHRCVLPLDAPQSEAG
jgi:hypothetical protein